MESIQKVNRPRNQTAIKMFGFRNEFDDLNEEKILLPLDDKGVKALDRSVVLYIKNTKELSSSFSAFAYYVTFNKMANIILSRILYK